MEPSRLIRNLEKKNRKNLILKEILSFHLVFCILREEKEKKEEK